MTRTLHTSLTPTPPVSGSLRTTSSPHCSSASHPTGQSGGAIPVLPTTRSTSTAEPGSAGGRAAGRPDGHRWRECGQVVDRQVERTVLTRAPAMSRWMTSQSAQNVTVTPARAGPSQNCLPATAGSPTPAPPARTPPAHPSRPETARTGSGCSGAGGGSDAASFDRGDGAQRGRQPQRQQHLGAAVGDEAAGRGVQVQRLVRPQRVVLDHPLLDCGLRRGQVVEVRHHRGHDAVPGVIINSGDHLASAPSTSRRPPTMSSCHNCIGASRCQRR